MKFPCAAVGFSKILAAEILQLITVVFAGTSVVLLTFIQTDADTQESLTLSLFLSLATTLISNVISVIIKAVGCFQASRDSGFFKLVAGLTLFSLAITFVSAFFGSNQEISSFITLISTAVDFIITLFVILGISNFASQLEEAAVLEAANRLFKVILCIGMISLATKYCKIILPADALDLILLLLEVSSVVLTIIQYILYIKLLSKTKVMLLMK